MMKSGNRIYRNWLYALLLIVFSSCIDETFTENTVEGTFLTVRGITPPGATTHEGTPEDRVVRTLRIRHLTGRLEIRLVMYLMLHQQEISFGILLIRERMILCFWPMNLLIYRLKPSWKLLVITVI
ncbi:hypothetical protein NXY00_18225 [Bacteroides sp. BFG-551]|nr:hypothetical protein [Bacteroides sp. BFG-551]